MRNQNFVIAIDGFSGSGKGTLSRQLSRHYKIKWLDTGKLYRIVAYEAIQKNIFDLEYLVKIADSLSVDTISQYSYSDLAEEKIGSVASSISVKPEIRAALLNVQRNFAYNNKSGAILDGRDIGTVVCPDAGYKIFVRASPEVRARRRFHELQNSGKNLSFEDVLNLMTERDKRDSEREFSPLIPANDAYVLDTSDKDVETMLRCAIDYIDGN